jgi:3-deoxy-D-manno-octulosonic acid kinase
MLARLYAQGMPVPAPIAARVQPRGLFYRADIVVERFDAATLAERLSEDRLALEQWYEIGLAVGRLHRMGVDHADLNAHNVLLSNHTGWAVRIIDFDRARLRNPHRHWQLRNLARLQRSLVKLSRQVPGFSSADQVALAELKRGWRDSVGGPPINGTQ